jgi:NADH:ubiquinone oxidoreductase subunit 6 (subunit J)
MDTSAMIAALVAEPWHIWLPVVLGAIAIYLLLPRPDSHSRRGQRWCGGLTSAAALVLAGRFLIHATGVHPEVILFYAFSAMAVISGGMMLTQINPVHAALSFAMVVLSSCGLFLLQAAPFLMAATTIVYAGAIVVTFLFVIMLAQQAGTSDADHRSREPLLASVGSFVLLAALLYLLQASYDTSALDAILARIREAKKQKTAQAMVEVLKDEEEDGQSNFKFLDRLGSIYAEPQGFFPQPRLANRIDIDRYKVDWGMARGIDADGKRVEAMRHVLIDLEKDIREVRDQYGSMKPSVSAPPRSQLSEELYSTNVTGEPAPGHLPVENTAFLGRSLFTDFLIAVELAGTLLMVAVIGAIAITHRREETR